MEMTNEQFADLHKRGVNYLRVLGVDTDLIDECLSRAFVELCATVETWRKEGREGTDETWANALWRDMIYRGVALNYKQQKRMVVEVGEDEPDIAIDVAEKDFKKKALLFIFNKLTDDDIISLLAYVDCDLNVARTAEYLGEQRTNMYHIIRRIREKAAKYLPVTGGKDRGKPQPSVEKVGEWSRNLNARELLPYDEWHPAFYDKKEAGGPTKSHVLPGTVPGSTPVLVSAPIVIEFELDECERVTIARGLIGDVRSGQFTFNQ